MANQESEQSTFHGLKLLKHCGGGAFGEVWYCEDISGRRLAVKIVSKVKLGDQWERELRGVVNYRRITENAPELLQIYHVEEDENSFFYTMEPADSASEDSYIPDTLAHRLQDGPIPQNRIFSVLSGIFSGIRTIHAAGFTHRDIKPDNILFVKGVPKLGDIGLMSSVSATMTQLAGTLDFLPPEIKADGASDSDRDSRQKNDLYAFGKVIYCVITGESPHNWPAVPPHMPLTLPLKFFLRLSFQLCKKEPAYRLDSIADVEKEFADIERKLLYGETLRDKVKYTLKVFLNNIRGGIYNLRHWSKKHWLILLTTIICCAGLVYWLSPEPPYDIAQQKIKKYTHKDIGFSIDLPFQWEVISEATIRKNFEEISKSAIPEHRKKQIMFFAELFASKSNYGAEMIVCDYEAKPFLDYILIQTVQIPGSEFLEISEEELRMSMRGMTKNELGTDMEIYEIKRISVANRLCIYLDISNDPQTRTCTYLFPLEDKCFSFALTAKKSTFQKRKEQFESVLSTLNFPEKYRAAVRK